MQWYRTGVKTLIVLFAACTVAIVGARIYLILGATNAGSHLVRAREAKEAGDLGEAIRSYEAYLGLVPDDTEVRAEFALTAIERANGIDATPTDRGPVVAILPETIRRIPENEEVRMAYVDVSIRWRLFQDALRNLEFLINKHPDEADLKVKKLKCLHQNGAIDGPVGAITYGYQLVGYDPATKRFDLGKAMAGDQPAAYSLLSNVIRAHRQDPDHAEEILDQMVVTNPESYRSYLDRGRYFLASDRSMDDGRTDIEKAYELNPKDADVLYVMIQLALKDHEDSLKSNEKSAEAFKLLQAMWEKTKSPQVLQIALNVITVRRDELGDRYDEIVDNWFAAALRETPNSVELLGNLGSHRDSQGRYAEAEEIYRKMLQGPELNGSDRGRILNNLAYLLAIQKKDVNDARDLVNEAVRLYGPTADMLDTLGVVKIAVGDGQGAVEDLELSLSDKPTASKYFHLAQAHLLTGDNRAALQAWNEGIDLNLGLDSISRLEHAAYKDVERKIEQIRSGEAQF